MAFIGVPRLPLVSKAEAALADCAKFARGRVRSQNSSVFPLKLTSEQVNRKVLNAIMGNVHTKVVFRVDVDHATHLAR